MCAPDVLSILRDVSDEEKGKTQENKEKEGNGDARDKEGKDKSDDEEGSRGGEAPGSSKKKRWFDAPRARANLQRTATLALQKKREEAEEVAKSLEGHLSWVRRPQYTALQQ